MKKKIMVLLVQMLQQPASLIHEFDVWLSVYNKGDTILFMAEKPLLLTYEHGVY
jgi:hypothetical protein